MLKRSLLWSRRHLLQYAAQTAVVAAVSGCGTLMYPERRGQKGGRLDWRVVALNGIGLLFFFIPGVIAFAVDFINGTIYLPEEPRPCEPPCLPTPVGRTGRSRSTRLVSYSIPRSELNQRGIESLIARKTGKTISLDDEECLSRELKSIDSFWETREQLDRHSLLQS